MDGYGPSTYGDRFADVYDDWYAEVTDVEATVTTLSALHPGGRLLELGVGTGRLALPLARAGLRVEGIDASAAMLERLAAKDPNGTVMAHLGDMVTDAPAGPFDLVLIAYNSIYNLPSAAAQEDLLHAMAARLSPEGRFVVEATVPAEDASASSEVRLRSMSADRVVLAVTRHDPQSQRLEGQFVEFTEADGVRLRPWSIRYISPTELDAMAAAAGLTLEHRWEDFRHREFTAHSDRHVSVYRLS